MNRPILFSLILVTAVLAAAIGGATLSGEQKPYPVVTSVKDGVKEILNPDFPRDGRFTGKLIEEMTWGDQAPPDAALLNKPIDMQVDDQGRIYILDQAMSRSKSMTPGGNS